jgi:formamidopyrimidine-DNA glycosylase
MGPGVPELPEVETVRRGLEPVVVGRRLDAVTVLHARAVRRQPEGGQAFSRWLAGATVVAVERRGKYLWFRLAGGPRPFLAAHLGMSGQFRASSDEAAGDHARVRFTLDDGTTLSFVDQRTFGWLLVDEDRGGVPRAVGHVAADPFDHRFDPVATADRLRGRRTGIKRALLDQTVVSGIGNIYADETLWRVRMHPSRATDSLTRREAVGVLESARGVMAEALLVGGTSFDPLYVNVNGESGWFARDLAVYGRAGEPCPRCGRAIVRESFTNRSSHRCPQCQRLPRRRR